MPPPGRSTFLTFRGIPLGEATLVIEALNSKGSVIGSTSQAVVIVLGTTTASTVTVAVTFFGITPTTATVTPRASTQFSAVGGSAPYTFSLVTSASGGTINEATGVYTAGPTGGSQDTVLVTDSSGGTASAVVNVGPSITVTPPAASVAPRATVSFQASGGSRSGYSWSLPQNRSGGSIDAVSGVYTAGVTGNTTDVVQVTDSGGNVATATLTVGPILSLTPTSSTIAPGAAIQFSASGGTGTGLRWTVSTNLSGATIDASGHYVAGPLGGVSDVITVTDSAGNSAVATANIVQTLQVTPVSPTVVPRGTLNLGATGGTAPFTFSLSTNSSGGSVTGNVYQAGPTGAVTDIVLCVDHVGNRALLSIAVGPVLGIVQGSAINLGPQGLLEFTTTGGSGTGLTWSLTSNGSGASIDSQSGAYYAGTANGADTVQVSDSVGNTATATVTVTPLSVPSSALNVANNASTQISPSGGSGSYQFSIPVNNSGATIDSQGNYTAGACINPMAPQDIVLISDANGGAPLAVTVDVPPYYQFGGGSGYTTGLAGQTILLNGPAPSDAWVVVFNNFPVIGAGLGSTGSGTTATYTFPTLGLGLGPQAQIDTVISSSSGTLSLLCSVVNGGILFNNAAPPAAVTAFSTVSLSASNFVTAALQWQLIASPGGSSSTIANSFTTNATFTPAAVAPMPLRGTLTSGSPTVTGVSSIDLARLSVGESVSHSALPAGTTVQSVSSTSFTLSQNATASASSTQLAAYGPTSFNISGTLTNGNATVTGVSTSHLAKLYVGAPVSAAGVPASTTVTAISNTSFTMSNTATAGGAATLQVTPIMKPQTYIVTMQCAGSLNHGSVVVTP